MNTKEENRLVKKCIKQDRLAQRLLYEHFKMAMFSTAYRITNDYDLAHDILQEAFIKVFKNLESYRGVGVLGGWIKTIVVRCSLKEIKGLHLQLEIEERLMDSHAGFDDSLTGELLDKIIRQLPERSRIVFDLIEVEGYSHKEVSELMGISIGTSKSQLHYAKVLLRKELTENGYEHRKKG